MSPPRNHDLVTQANSCCNQIHAGTVFFILNYTCRLHHCAEGSMHHLRIGERRANITAQLRRTALMFTSKLLIHEEMHVLLLYCNMVWLV